MLRKLDPAFGKVARNWGKSWVSFWEGTDKLGKKVGSVFGKLLINLNRTCWERIRKISRKESED